MFKVSRLIDVHLNSQIQIPLRKILNEAFEDDFSEEDWQHTYGGVRFLGHLDGHLISHGAVVPRKMQVDGASMLVGYVEGIAVSPGFQRKGFGSLLLEEITSYCKSDFPLSMLSTDEKVFYERQNWLDFEGNSYVFKDGVVIRSNDEDEGLMYLPGLSQDMGSPKKVICESRVGDAW